MTNESTKGHVPMYFQMAKRLMRETDKRLVWKLIWNAGFRGIRSVQKHKQRLRRGQFFPPFLYVSVINSCNLRCQGCWVDVAAKQARIDRPALDRLIGQAKAMGNSFFGILGGEPLMHGELLDTLAGHPDCYFQVFTNGHFITDQMAARLRQMGNVTPLISIEGNEIVSDQRRGRPNVLTQTMQGLRHCLRHKVLTGVCTSLCQTNFQDLLREEWVDRLIEMGVFYAWFHIYRPVGPDAAPHLCLTPQQQRQARQFVVRMRAIKPIIIIDAYYDGEGRALCPAATGFTHHISPWGDIEPCPVIQLAKETIHDPRPLAEVFQQSEFLRDFRRTAAQATRGCIVLERPDLLQQLAHRHGARDTTARQRSLAELAEMQSHPSQYDPGHEIPEANWAYRLVKRFWFHDYGTYARHFHHENWRPTANGTGRGPFSGQSVVSTSYAAVSGQK